MAYPELPVKGFWVVSRKVSNVISDPVWSIAENGGLGSDGRPKEEVAKWEEGSPEAIEVVMDGCDRWFK